MKMMSEKNTQKNNQVRIANAIEMWYLGHTYGPSYRDISRITGISLGTVFNVCKELKEINVIELNEKVARSIKLKGKE
jgi:ABC-type Fe3+-siderophore transport system permease subunit